MKPSYELSERLVEELHRRGIHALGWNDAVYGALRAALASEPEPTYPGRTSEEEAQLRKHPEFEPGAPTYVEWLREQHRAAETRVRELDAQVSLLIAKEAETFERAFRAEAKLDKVRAWGDESELMSGDHRRLLAILDKAP